MKEVKFLNASYEAGSSIQMQGSRETIKPYLDKGYYVKEDRNGYWVLVKSAKVNVIIRTEVGIKEANLKHDICDYYKQSRISLALFNRFYKEARDGKIKFYLDKDQLVIV